MHSSAPASWEMWPASHRRQSDSDEEFVCLLYLPESQSLQEMKPMSAEYFPGEQLMHVFGEVAPVESLALPAEQDVHCCCPVSLAYSPCEQDVHSVTPEMSLALPS